MVRVKNQGQSTVEYLLVVAVASFFVLSLAVYMNPKLTSMLSGLEDVVAAKIRGGELVAHYKGGAGKGETLASAKGSGEGSTTHEGEAGSESGGGGGGGGSIASRPDMGDLEEGSSKGKKGGSSQDAGGMGGGEGESSSTIIESGGGNSRNAPAVSASQESKTEGKKEKSTAEEDKSSKGRGILYQEGQEEEAIGGTPFNWMRLIIMLLIVIVGVFVAFEIYKSVKMSRK